MEKPDPEKKSLYGFTSIPSSVLVASIFLALASIFGLAINDKENQTRLIIEPTTNFITKGDTFTAQLILESDTPVNAVETEINIDPNLLEVTNIAYDDTIIDLWIFEPTYKNDKNTITLAGGMTRPNGFTGQGEILTLTLKAKESGKGSLTLTNSEVLKHDGTGASANAKIVNADYQIKQPESLIGSIQTEPAPEPSKTDLNGDGKFTLADISLFFAQLLNVH